jgi:hypothetical protein
VWGRAGPNWGRADFANPGTNKKEEFPGFMDNMQPGNSFPQICVVSGNSFVDDAADAQEYLRVVAFSNTLSLSNDN